jgi:fructose-1,6-bisphosphatase
MGCDPLDGSSVIDANFSVGSIFGIWPGKGLVGRSGREQVAAAVSLYGPRTLLCIALPEQGKVFEVTLVKNRTNWEVSRPDIKIKPAGKIFAPGNLRATNDHAKYNQLMQYWMAERYQLRYTGGMVPDGTSPNSLVSHILYCLDTKFPNQLTLTILTLCLYNHFFLAFLVTTVYHMFAKSKGKEILCIVSLRWTL